MCTTNHCTELLPLYLQAGVWDDHIDAHLMEVLHPRSSGLEICSTYLDAKVCFQCRTHLTILDGGARPVRELNRRDIFYKVDLSLHNIAY